jgi:hypothetical protein
MASFRSPHDKPDKYYEVTDVFVRHIMDDAVYVRKRSLLLEC